MVFIRDSCLIGSILFEKKMVGHVTFRLLGLPSYSSELGDPLFGSTVFDDNGSIFFEKKIVDHVTIVGHVTFCLFELPSANTCCE